MFLNENVPLIRATPRHQWKYNFRRSFVIENVERTTINRDEHLLPIHYRSSKKTIALLPPFPAKVHQASRSRRGVIIAHSASPTFHVR